VEPWVGTTRLGVVGSAATVSTLLWLHSFRAS
jgi:hypothetical protein